MHRTNKYKPNLPSRQLQTTAQMFSKPFGSLADHIIVIMNRLHHVSCAEGTDEWHFSRRMMQCLVEVSATSAVCSL